jgi:hypothetical protein
MVTLMKWSNFLKSVSKITVKKFYEVDPWGQCYKTNTAVIYCHFKLNYHRNVYNIEFTLQ